MNRELLDHWSERGLAVPDAGDGAWAWTETGKARLTEMARCLMSDMLYGRAAPVYMRNHLAKQDVNPDTGMLPHDDWDELEDKVVRDSWRMEGY